MDGYRYYTGPEIRIIEFKKHLQDTEVPRFFQQMLIIDMQVYIIDDYKKFRA